MLFRKKPGPGDSPSPEEMAERLGQLSSMDQSLRSAIAALTGLMKALSLDLEELKTTRFRQQVDEMAERLAGAERAPVVDKALKNHVPDFETFARRQSEYLVEREAELRNVIQLLSNAMTLLNRENAAYHQQILDQGDNFKQIIALDDLRKIKRALTREVEELTSMVQSKQRAEKQQLAELSDQVEVLREELKKSQEEGRRDSLTGVFNRRALEEFLQSLVQENRISPVPFAVLIFDIDSFKQVNDRHGHLIGDQVIQAIAKLCQQILREEDFVARFGGEEFVAVMPGANRKTAARRAESLRQTVAETLFTLPAGSREKNLQITLSAGVSEFRPGEAVKDLLERADQALYLAKQSGKNRVATD